MKPVPALVTEAVEIAPALSLIWFEAPEVRRPAQPAQFLMLQCGDTLDPYLPRPFSFSGTRRSDRGGTQHALLVGASGRGSSWLARRRPGDRLTVLGPLGRPLTIGAATRNGLLIGYGVHVGPLLFLAEQAAARDLNVTLVQGAALGVPSVPAEMLPPEVELVNARDGEGGRATAEAARDYLQWADQVFVSGPEPLLRQLSAEVKRLAVRRSVQAVVWQRLACGTGLCGDCAIETRRHGRRLICRDGPRFELSDLY